MYVFHFYSFFFVSFIVHCGCVLCMGVCVCVCMYGLLPDSNKDWLIDYIKLFLRVCERYYTNLYFVSGSTGIQLIKLPETFENKTTLSFDSVVLVSNVSVTRRSQDAVWNIWVSFRSRDSDFSWCVECIAKLTYIIKHLRVRNLGDICKKIRPKQCCIQAG